MKQWVLAKGGTTMQSQEEIVVFAVINVRKMFKLYQHNQETHRSMAVFVMVG